MTNFQMNDTFIGILSDKLSEITKLAIEQASI